MIFWALEPEPEANMATRFFTNLDFGQK